MKIKRKAVPNKVAKDIPLEVSQSLGCRGVHNNEASGSTSVDRLGVNYVVGHSSLPVSCPVASAGIQNSVGGSFSIRDVVVPCSSTTAAAMEIGEASGGYGIVFVGQDVGFNTERFLPVLPLCNAGSPAFVPAQAATINDITGGVGSLEPAAHVPMLLDFSTGSVAPLANLDAWAVANDPAGSQRSGVPLRIRRRAGRVRSSRRRVHTSNDQRRMDEPDGPPMQGPVAPPQRDGPPLEYRCFRRCDQICQHCGALFWLEEKRSGLAASVAPQYRRCCSAGRESIIEGLINFLNDNNALVKLFRTVRDKLQEADIPNFSIRLFGVSGANQYELPTADGIGAIVYEGGPETITDYDIVIQRHSGEPESVNKLHPAYMALQFPLLFIHGEEGYHLKLTPRDLQGHDEQEPKKMSMKAYYARKNQPLVMFKKMEEKNCGEEESQET
ncbi:hypothetical protein CTI12_AA480130 [Artemisia annua]|uniref:Helitron helicase-like domain-containing protein n=1 Tax=Artemisia annua TaxID=35608 RepID=A0A2U1LKB6_ARTAN|nr:hypothetical protein CTI12_AA480130 [Artemisia annua]